MFQTLHNMFMGPIPDLERPRHDRRGIRSLGYRRPAPKQFVALSSIPEEGRECRGQDMIRQLVAGQEAVTRTAREVFKVVEKTNDQPTADLLTQRMEVLKERLDAAQSAGGVTAHLSRFT